MEDCIQLLADGQLRVQFEIELDAFLSTIDVVLPLPEALRYLPQAKLFAEIARQTRRRYREAGDFDPSLYGEREGPRANRRAHDLARRRERAWAQRMGVHVTELRVLPLGFRWGSCSPNGKVNIHWATMQLAPDLIDYVLAHELAHVHHRDHNVEFWRAVDRAMPGWESRRTRLKQVGPDLWLPSN